jgi:6-phosphogluconolactonase (cycloisomerase 2 family)
MQAAANTIHMFVLVSCRYVYGSNRANDTEGTIVIFAIDATTGGLSLVGHVGCGGVTPRNFALHPSGEWLVVANQTTGNLVVFDVDRETGWLKQSSAAGSEEGGGADGAGGGVLPLLQTPLCVQFVPVLE